MLDTVLPSLLPLDIIWLLRQPEGLSGPKISFKVFLELVYYFEHVVERNWGFGVVVRVIPGKWMNQYTNHNFRKLNFEGSLTSDPASKIAVNRRAVVSSRA
jgi:hypothetical protein